MMFIRVSHPHPLSKQTARGGSSKHNTIEQHRLTIFCDRKSDFLEPMTHFLDIGVVSCKEKFQLPYLYLLS